MKIYNVIIVDDHLLLSQALATMVNSFQQFHVLDLASNGLHLIEKLDASTQSPDLILMDVNMPKMNGIETTKWLKEHHPDIKVLALSVEDHDETILKMIKAGAKGYILKDSEKSVLEKALLDVIENDFYHSKQVTEIFLNNVHGNKENKLVLKEREIEFMKLACTEMTYKEIAEVMHLSPKTIDGYRDTLFSKLNIKNRIGLVTYAIKHKYYTV